MSELFTSADPAQNTSKNYDNWDLEALKRKAEAADAHIKAIEAENSALRQNTDTTSTLEEVLEKLDLLNQVPQNFMPSSGVTNLPVEKPNSSQSLTKDEVVAMVASAIEENRKKSTAKQNVDVIKQELEKTWGPNYPTRLSEKATQLGVSTDYLSSMAESYPQAFLKLVLDEKTNTNPNSHTPPTTTVRPVMGDQPMSKWKDFSAAMKANPRLRSDVAFQRRLHETAEKLGESFYN